MTLKTDYHLPTSELMQTGETYARLGLDCPWVGEGAWCDLKNEHIYDSDKDLPNNYDGVVSCPPAVAAAVVAFAHSGEFRLFAHTKARNSISVPEPMWSRDKIVGYTYGFGVETYEATSMLAAAVALILAVHKAVEADNG